VKQNDTGKSRESLECEDVYIKIYGRV